MKVLPIIAIAVVAISLTGCAQRQFVPGHGLAPSETVKVTSLPAGATATSSYGQSCETPCYLPLLRERGGEITVAMAGYRTERFSIGSSVSDRMVARAGASHAIEAIDPDPVSIALTGLATILDGKGGMMELDVKDIDVALVELEEGEEDLLAPATPLTGERLPIDIGTSD